MAVETQAELGIVILAGGQGQRMNGLDKGWLDYQGQPLIHRLIEQLKKQFNGSIVISANRHLSRYASLGLPILTDPKIDQQLQYGGPLIGIQQALISGMAKQWLSCPVDVPNIPADYVKKMSQTQAELVVAATAEQIHYAHLLVNTNQLASLNTYLHSRQRSIKGWLAQQDYQLIDFSANKAEFTNLNYPHQLEGSSLANSPSLRC